MNARLQVFGGGIGLAVLLGAGSLRAEVVMEEFSFSINEGTFQAVVGGDVGTTYTFEGSPDLRNWTRLQTVGGADTAAVVSPSGSISLALPETGLPRYFVRLNSNFALRFYGSGTAAPDLDRVKIRIDDPTTPDDPSPPIDVGNEDFTIEFWMLALSDDNTARAIQPGPSEDWIYGNIIVDRDRHTQGRDYGISLGAGRVAFGVSNFDSSWTIYGNTRVDDGNWHHIAVQRRRSDGALWLYVDGRLDASASPGEGPDGDISYPNNEEPGPYCQGAQCVNSDPFIVLAAEKHDAGTDFPSYNGLIDELRFSNTLRYSGDFIRPNRVFTPDAFTVGLFHFDDGAGDTVSDSAIAPGGPSPGVRQVGGANSGPEWVISTVPLQGPDAPLDQNPPSVPGSLNVSFVDFDEVILTWNPSIDDSGTVLGYRIFRDAVPIGTSNTPGFTDASLLSPSTSYSYTVAAFDGAGNFSAPSAPAVIDTPAGSSEVTVDFDNPAPPAGSTNLDGIFQGIDFGTGQWNWVSGFPPTNSISIFFSSNENSRTFTFAGGARTLDSLVVYTTSTGTLTISDGQNNPVVLEITQGGGLQPVTTGWTTPSTTVTVSFTQGWSLGIDELVYSLP